MPSRQRWQRPHPAWTSTAMRSPIWNSSTVGPSFTTVPIYSWPGREAAVERQLAIDHRRHAVLDDLDVGRADRDRVDPHQHLGRRPAPAPASRPAPAPPGRRAPRPSSSSGSDTRWRGARFIRVQISDLERQLRLVFEPDIGQILADEMARRDVPALEPRRGRDDAVPPQERNRIGLGQRVALEIAHDLGALPRVGRSPPGRYRARRESGRSTRNN